MTQEGGDHCRKFNVCQVQTDPYSLPDVLMIVTTADRARIKDHPTAFENERRAKK